MLGKLTQCFIVLGKLFDKLTQGLILKSKHRVCIWQINTGFVFGKLTQGLRFLSSTRFVLVKLTQGLYSYGPTQHMDEFNQ